MIRLSSAALSAPLILIPAASAAAQVFQGPASRWDRLKDLLDDREDRRDRRVDVFDRREDRRDRREDRRDRRDG